MKKLLMQLDKIQLKDILGGVKDYPIDLEQMQPGCSFSCESCDDGCKDGCREGCKDSSK
jgi:hypothetical protein